MLFCVSDEGESGESGDYGVCEFVIVDLGDFELFVHVDEDLFDVVEYLCDGYRLLLYGLGDVGVGEYEGTSG